LTKLTKKNARWQWDEKEQVFQTLKNFLASSPILVCPDFNRRFVLQIDASTELGVVLTQHSRKRKESLPTPAGRSNYNATELECLVIVWGIRNFRGYLEGYEFSVITDHQAGSPLALQKLESSTGRLGRWMLELQQYTFDVKYRRGRLNRVDLLAITRDYYALSAARAAPDITSSSVGSAKNQMITPTTP